MIFLFFFVSFFFLPKKVCCVLLALMANLYPHEVTRCGAVKKMQPPAFFQRKAFFANESRLHRETQLSRCVGVADYCFPNNTKS